MQTLSTLFMIGRFVNARVFLVALVWCFHSAAFAEEAPKSIYEAAARSRLEVLATNQTNVQFLSSLTNLPASVRGKLVAMADKGQPFSSGCVGSDPHRRFLAATKAGRIYNVAYEQGGIVHAWLIVQFVVDETGKVILMTRIETVDPVSRGQSFKSQQIGLPLAADSHR